MYTDGLIHRDTTENPNEGISIADVQKAVGRGENDLGLLCSDQEWYENNGTPALRDAGQLNPYAKFKPLALVPTAQHPEYMGEITDSVRATNLYGFSIPVVTTAKDLFDVEFAYNKPTSWFRLLDFGSTEYPNTRGYFNQAQPTLCCVTPNGSTVVYNAINENALAVEFLFYVYSKYGSRSNNFLFARLCEPNKAISDMGDCTFNSSALRECVVAIEDMTVNSRAFIGNGNTYFGVALFKDNYKNGYVGSLFCNTPLGYRATAVTDMCGMNVAIPSTTFPVGDYVAIPFLSVGNSDTQGTVYFHPLPKYPTLGGIHKVNVQVGSTEQYKIAFVGVAISSVDSPVATLTMQTIQDSVYLFIDITNLSSRLHQTGVSTSGNWILKSKVNGSVVKQAGENPVSLTNVEHTSYNSYNFQITAGGTTRIPFLVSRIWNSDPSQPSTTTISGNITISPELYYQSEEFENIDIAHTVPTIRVKFNWS